MELTLDEQGTHALFGNHDENLRLIEDAFDVRISARGSEIKVQGDADNVKPVEKLLAQMQALIESGYPLKKSDILTGVRVLREKPETNLIDFFADDSLQPAVKRVATPRNVAQKMYLQRIILCRPAVEAGERLGFLPGDIAEKVNPYLRPLYDSLYDIIGFEKVEKMMERTVIEIAPLAFMRGRTLNDSFIILDEAQNTTPEQMKMFLTRLGFGSKCVVTGDVTQVDLPTGKKSGLREARLILDRVEGIKFFDFTDRDVVRHPLVSKIVVAYDRIERERREAEQTPEPAS